MRRYASFIEDDNKEKIVGGLLNLSQALWLAGGLATGLSIGMLTYSLTKVTLLAIIMVIPPNIVTVIFAFNTQHGMTLMKYLITKKAFDQQNEFVPNCRVELMHAITDSSPNPAPNLYTETEPYVFIKTSELKKQALHKTGSPTQSQNKKDDSSSIFSLKTDVLKSQ